MEEQLRTYYADNAKRLHAMVDKILLRFGGLSEKDRDDFYSLANEVFVDVMRRYDHTQSFETFLYSCLLNRMRTEMSRRNCIKRKIDRMAVSIDMPIGDEEDATLADLIPDHFSVEMEVLEREGVNYSTRMLSYLSRLSGLQREVLRLQSAGYLPSEIKGGLKISEKQYTDCCAAIHSYRNVLVLF